ncbi:MAG: alpha/beta hydrolase [Candidatus Kariarchaeaceae archaeon]|jgi:carboxylesterase
MIEDDKVEKIAIPPTERVSVTLARKLGAVGRSLLLGLEEGLADTVHLLGQVFVPQSVDRTIKPSSGWFEIKPTAPNGRAILLCHGFAATPEIFREVAPFLAAEGYYVRAIRLSGHGTSIGHLAQTTSAEWFASVVWHYQEVCKDYSEIGYIGHSLGGTLGMLLGTVYPLTTIIAMCSPVELDIGPARFVRQASILVKYWPRSKKKRERNKRENVSSYAASPLFAIGGIFDACSVLRERYEKLKIPMLYISAGLDHQTLQVQPDKIRKYLTETPVTFKRAESSPHSLLLGPERETVKDWLISWMNERVWTES